MERYAAYSLKHCVLTVAFSVCFGNGGRVDFVRQRAASQGHDRGMTPKGFIETIVTGWG